MLAIIVVSSFAGGYMTLDSMYDEVAVIFENGADGDGICVKNDLMERANCATNMCTVARRYLDSSYDEDIEELSDAASELKAADSIELMQTANDTLTDAMNTVYNALEADESVSAHDPALYIKLYSEFESRGDTIRHDDYNTAAARYNSETSGLFARFIKAVTPVRDAVLFY